MWRRLPRLANCWDRCQSRRCRCRSRLCRLLSGRWFMVVVRMLVGSHMPRCLWFVLSHSVHLPSCCVLSTMFDGQHLDTFAALTRRQDLKHTKYTQQTTLKIETFEEWWEHIKVIRLTACVYKCLNICMSTFPDLYTDFEPIDSGDFQLENTLSHKHTKRVSEKIVKMIGSHENELFEGGLYNT